MYISPDEFPLPWEYRNWTFDGLVGAPPDDLDERAIVFLDCGNIDRMPVDFLQREGLHILNIDHHHDNTRFGTVNLVVPEASCTAEIVWRLAKELGAELTPEIAEALYTGLVTDTGRFMYENTGVEAHRMAADLIAAGVEPRAGLEAALRGPSLQPPGAAAAGARDGRAPRSRGDDGRPPRQVGLRGDRCARDGFRGRDRPPARGAGHQGRRARARAAGGGPRRHAQGEPAGHRRTVDVSRIARAYGGGGHTQAAGFSTDIPYPELVEGLRVQVDEQLAG